MIHFNVPPFTGKEFEYMHESVNNHKICGDGPFTKKCDEWMEKRFKAKRLLQLINTVMAEESPGSVI